MLLHDNKQYNNNYHHIITEEPLKSVSEKVLLWFILFMFAHFYEGHQKSGCYIIDEYVEIKLTRVGQKIKCQWHMTRPRQQILDLAVFSQLLTKKTHLSGFS